MVQEYCLEHKLKIEVDLFPDGKQMLDCFTPGKYQVLFLDIYMPMMRGINVAKAIREQDTACQLVFVTVSADHALESYEVYAAGYLLKPYTKEDLTETLDWCLENISPMAQALEITFERERVQLILSDIRYIEVYGREGRYPYKKPGLFDQPQLNGAGARIARGFFKVSSQLYCEYELRFQYEYV